MRTKKTATLSPIATLPIVALGAGLLLSGMAFVLPAHAATTAVSHSTKKDAGAAARRQTRMSGHKSTHHVMHHSMAHKSKTMGHKTAHQNQKQGATTKTP